jgi:riboflavin biosynthesis pyrimidine reductase
VRRLLPDPPVSIPDDEQLTAAYAPPDEPARHLRMNFVASVDGAATVAGTSGGLATAGDSRIFDLLRDMCDVILVGAGTVRAEGYTQPEYAPQRRARRRSFGLAEVPPYAVISESLALDPASPLFTAADPRTIVITHGGASSEQQTALSAVADLIVAGTDRIDLAGAVDQLASRGLNRVLCEGGPHLFGSLLAADLVDELCLTVSPRLAGAGPMRIIAGDPLPDHSWPLTLTHLLTEEGALFLRYHVDHSAGRAGG